MKTITCEILDLTSEIKDEINKLKLKIDKFIELYNSKDKDKKKVN